jgi:H+/Cl- antiporter ClcA
MSIIHPNIVPEKIQLNNNDLSSKSEMMTEATLSSSNSIQGTNYLEATSASGNGASMTQSVSMNSLQLINPLVHRRSTVGKMARKPKIKDEEFEAVDMYSSYNLKDMDELLPETGSVKPKSVLDYIKYFINRYMVKNNSFLSINFLSLLAIACVFAIISLDFIIHKLELARTNIYSLTSSFIVNYSIYLCFCLVFSILAAGCVHLISNESPGSGIPEMKCILSGNMMERYLNFRTLVAKYLGILCGIGAGFPAARYGPSVHLSGCICNLLLKLKPFARLNKNELEKASMLSAACASGVAGAIGAPFGGVLFSIEVTSSYYKIENLWRAVFCTLVGSFFFYTWRQTGFLGNTEPPLYSTKFKPMAYTYREYLIFIIIGVCCGLISAIFVFIFHKLVRLRQDFKMVNTTRYTMVGAVACITASLSFSMYPLLYVSPTRVINQLFALSPLEEPRVFLALIVFIIEKLIITAIIAAMPVTSGVLGPSMMIGAAVGRLIGEVTVLFWKDVVPGGYAVVGATALSAGVTRSLSPIVVMFELTGQLSFMVPTMIASVLAVGIGDLFNKSIYDTILYLRGLPYLGSIRNPENYKLTAADVMRTKLDWIAINMTAKELSDAISKSKHEIYPVVEDSVSLNFLGSATRQQLLKYLEHLFHKDPSTKTEDLDTASNPNKDMQFPIDESAFSVSSTTKLGKLHFLISTVGLSHAWVLSRRKLVGVVTKRDLIKLQL